MNSALFCVVSWHPKLFIFTNQAPALLYYSHIPTIIISLALGFFVFYNSGKSLLGLLLFSTSFIFSLWSILDLMVWVGDNSILMMFVWSFFGLLFGLICILSVYFVYVFVDKRDVSIFKKIIFLLLLLPTILFTPTHYNLNIFDIAVCTAKESSYFTKYYYAIGLVSFLWILVLVINRYRKKDHEFKKQIMYLAIGIEMFLFSFFVAGFIASYLVEKGYFTDFGLEKYGLFGMTFFMGMLAYLIVKFKAFNIKLIGAQALVYALVIIIGSQFFFIQNNTNKILTGITLALAIGFGFFLIKSIKEEVRRKEELQKMTEQLAVANDELRKLDNA